MLIFQNTKASGDIDTLTSHQSCPVTKGEKVVISRFIRQDTCYLNKYFSKRKWNGNVWCQDDHTRCAEWAAKGYCKAEDPATAIMMAGDDDWPGFCERTCKACRCAAVLVQYSV